MAGRLLLALLLLASATPVAAQDRLTVFLHGFASNASTWQSTANRLGARLQITPALPDLPWLDGFHAQAAHLDYLASVYGAPSNMVAVGHSNGGVVARALATRRNLGGIVTMGSPHRGAPLIANLGVVSTHYAQAGNDLGSLLYALGAVNGTNKYTGLWFSPGLSWLRTGIAALGQAIRFASDGLYHAAGAVFVSPVGDDMRPGAGTLSSLNSPANLSRESAVVPGRAGLVFAARNWHIGAPFVGLAPSHQYSGDTAVRTGILFLAYIEEYFTPPNVSAFDTDATTIRTLARRLISNLVLFNSVWCFGTTNAADCSVSSDGIVPTESQFFPGDAKNFGFYGPPHIWQTAESENYIHQALVDVVGLTPRGSTGGSGGGSGGGGGGSSQSTLTAGQILYPDTEIRSPNSQYALRYQSDGNLVLYGPHGALWASGTAGTSPGFVGMQGDGNLVVYDAGGQAVWASDTAGLPGLELHLQDDGYIVIYDDGGNVVWYRPE
jgi:pimeloyl-ACP methyl ester carboxylesterase